jgi:hypothetical protein
VSMWLVTQVPSLDELGDQSGPLRSMLVGGNVVCLRTSDRYSGGMLGLPADPHDIPQYFRDGSYAYGLGYVIGPDGRQAIARTDTPTTAQRRLAYRLPALDPGFAAILSRFGQPKATEGNGEGNGPALTGIPQGDSPDDPPAPGGQTAADAVLAVLTRRMPRGDILAAVKTQAAAWGRDQPWSLRSVSTALTALTRDGRIVSLGGREGLYEPAGESPAESPDIPLLSLEDEHHV